MQHPDRKNNPAIIDSNHGIYSKEYFEEAPAVKESDRSVPANLLFSCWWKSATA